MYCWNRVIWACHSKSLKCSLIAWLVSGRNVFIAFFILKTCVSFFHLPSQLTWVWQRQSCIHCPLFSLTTGKIEGNYIHHFIISLSTESGSGSIMLDSWPFSMNQVFILTFKFYLTLISKCQRSPLHQELCSICVEFTAPLLHLYVVLVLGDDWYQNLWSIVSSSFSTHSSRAHPLYISSLFSC